MDIGKEDPMGLFAWLLGQRDQGSGSWKAVSCEALFAAAAEYTAAELAFELCVDMVANALGRCDFLTYVEGKEVRDREHWLWNIQPNLNENSTEFLHKLVDSLYRRNEALVVSFRHRDGYEMLAVADSWEQGEAQVTRMNEYTGVTVDSYTFRKRFREDEVLHLRLNQRAIRPVIERLTHAWNDMASLAKKHYEWDQGHHWKVHLDQMSAGDKEFETNFSQMIQKQVQPFFENPNGILPEFDGYKFESLGSGGSGSSVSSGSGRVEDVRNLVGDIFDFTARGFLIPVVLLNGKVEGTKDAKSRFLSDVVDPLCDQLQEEVNRKRYGFDAWRSGNYLRIDSSSIIHYDLFDQAASVEKLIGSGVYTINDILRAAGREPINAPWADRHYLTKNIADIGEVAIALTE